MWCGDYFLQIAMFEHREKVGAEVEAEETDEFDNDSPLPKAVGLDMNLTDSDQTKVKLLTGFDMIAMKC